MMGAGVVQGMGMVWPCVVCVQGGEVKDEEYKAIFAAIVR